MGILGYCNRHGVTEFVLRGKNKNKCICKLCEQEAVSKRRKLIKEKLIKYKGGKCEKCGYCKNIHALEFHHINPNGKEFTISSKNISLKKLKKEVDKCILLCSNCHREMHDEIKKNENKEKEQFYKDKAEKDLIAIQNGSIKLDIIKKKTNNFINVPLEEIYNEHYKNKLSISDLAKKYNCSISTIKRKILQYKKINHILTK